MHDPLMKEPSVGHSGRSMVTYIYGAILSHYLCSSEKSNLEGADGVKQASGRICHDGRPFARAGDPTGCGGRGIQHIYMPDSRPRPRPRPRANSLSNSISCELSAPS